MTKRLGAVNSRLVPRSRNGNRRSRRGPYNWNALQGENRNKATDPFGLDASDKSSGLTAVVQTVDKVLQTIGQYTIPGYSNLKAAADSALAGKPVDAVQYTISAAAQAGTAAMGTSILGALASKATEVVGNAASSAINALKLNKSLASQQQVGEILSGNGTPLAGSGTGKTLRDAERLASQYGGNVEDWAKVGSSNFKAADGTSFETHAYQNFTTGSIVELKTKFQ